MAKRLGVSRIDEQADTDEPSYFKQTSKKTTLLVGVASEVFVGNDSIIPIVGGLSADQMNGSGTKMSMSLLSR